MCRDRLRWLWVIKLVICSAVSPVQFDCWIPDPKKGHSSFITFLIAGLSVLLFLNPRIYISICAGKGAGSGIPGWAINTTASASLIQKQEKSKMSNLEKLIAAGNWGGFFDALDVNRDGTLSHQEFWKREKIGSSDALVDALDKLDVSFNIFRATRENDISENRQR